MYQISAISSVYTVYIHAKLVLLNGRLVLWNVLQHISHAVRKYLNEFHVFRTRVSRPTTQVLRLATRYSFLWMAICSWRAVISFFGTLSNIFSLGSTISDSGYNYSKRGGIYTNTVLNKERKKYCAWLITVQMRQLSLYSVNFSSASNLILYFYLRLVCMSSACRICARYDKWHKGK
jgi:hypothetical protein